MKTLFFCCLITCLSGGVCSAQSCAGVTLKTGQTFEMSMFSAKDKLTGKVNYTIDNVRREGSNTLVDLTARMQDEKGKQQSPYTIRYTCTGNELMADLSGMAQGMQNAGMKDAQLKMKTNQLVYPGTLSVAQKLPDGQLEADFINNGSTLLEMSMTMSNRLVEGQQSVTTPAGTFDTHKVTSDVSFTNRVMGIPIRGNMRVVSYRASNQILDIKSETYNKNGKLMGYSLLSQAN